MFVSCSSFIRAACVFIVSFDRLSRADFSVFRLALATTMHSGTLNGSRLRAFVSMGQTRAKPDDQVQSNKALHTNENIHPPQNLIHPNERTNAHQLSPLRTPREKKKRVTKSPHQLTQLPNLPPRLRKTNTPLQTLQPPSRPLIRHDLRHLTIFPVLV